MVTKSTIWVTFRREGIHAYPAAATKPGLEDVSFLASPHRHIFHFRVEMQVFHDDRDVEFIQFKRELEGLYTGEVLMLNNKSCEMICWDILHHIKHKYPKRNVCITVSEDGENGATINYEEYLW